MSGSERAGAANGLSTPCAFPTGAAEWEQGRSTVEGRMVAFRTCGTGDVALVLIHGGLCEGSFWHLQAPLGSRFRVVAVDLAGHGESRASDEALSIRTLAKDVAAVMADVGAGACVLAGHSFGSLVAMEAARLDPGRVAGVVAIDFLHAARVASPTPGPSGAHALREAMRRNMFAASSDEATREHVLDAMLGVAPALMAALRTASAGYDAEAALRGVDGMPLSMIFGGMRPVDVAALRAVRPDARLFFLPKSGHFVMLDEPAAFNDLLATEVRLMVGALERL